MVGILGKKHKGLNLLYETIQTKFDKIVQNLFGCLDGY